MSTADRQYRMNLARKLEKIRQNKDHHALRLSECLQEERQTEAMIRKLKTTEDGR